MLSTARAFLDVDEASVTNDTNIKNIFLYNMLWFESNNAGDVTQISKTFHVVLNTGQALLSIF